MFLHWSFSSVVFIVISIIQISSIHSTPLDTPHSLHSLMENILGENNFNEQLFLFNQLREYLNRMCMDGYFGSSHAHACQRIVEFVNRNNEEENHPHGIEKRFFCNGFIGCKNAGRRPIE